MTKKRRIVIPSTELDHHLALWDWARAMRSQHSELKSLFHIPSGELRPPGVGRKLKKMGAPKGIPDWCLPVRRGRFGSLWIELKREDGTLSVEQAAWIELLIEQGQAAGCCKHWEHAASIILQYLKL